MSVSGVDESVPDEGNPEPIHRVKSGRGSGRVPPRLGHFPELVDLRFVDGVVL